MQTVLCVSALKLLSADRNDADSVLLRRLGKRDLLVIRVAETREITTVKREVESLEREMCALRPGQLSTSEVRQPWTPEEKTSPRGQWPRCVRQ